MHPILLASSSPSRHKLMQNMNIAFQTASPNIDESQLPDETSYDMVCRLAQKKAQAVVAMPETLIVASDQIIQVDSKILGKPNDYAHAFDQLNFCRGKIAKSLTSLYVVCKKTGFSRTTCVITKISYRNFRTTDIKNYLQTHRPYECAGSIRIETDGHLLISALSSDDLMQSMDYHYCRSLHIY